MTRGPVSITQGIHRPRLAASIDKECRAAIRAVGWKKEVAI